MVDAQRGGVKKIIFLRFNNGTISNKADRFRKDRSSQIAFLLFDKIMK